MINMNSHAQDMYLPISIKCCHFALKRICISKTIRCFWLTLYKLCSNRWTYWFCIKHNGMSYMETKDPNSLYSDLRNPDILVWVASFFHTICPLSASPTKRKHQVPLKCFHLLPNATTQMPTRKPQILNIIIQQFFLKRSLKAICFLNSFLTSNELRTSHVCLLISTQLSQRWHSTHNKMTNSKK